MRQPPEPGDTFEGHVIEGVIGRGGMGVVLRARNVVLDRQRAIKVIAPEISADPAYAARFRRESRLAASVEHPNVVPVHGAGEDDGLLFIVMRLVEGVDLHRLLEGGPLSPERTVAIIRETAAALDAAHRAGLVHRDVKPANVLIEPRTGGEHVYLTDFGISKPTATKTAGGPGNRDDTALTLEGEVLGTSDYVAPEQVEDGTSDARSDVYSLACVAYHALTGAPPFRRDTEIATLIAQTKAERPSASQLRPELTPEVDGALLRGMAIDPDERPQTAGAFAELLGRALGGEATPVVRRRPAADRHETATTAMARPPSGGGGWRRPALIGGALVLGLAAVAAVLVLGGGDGGGDGGVGEQPSTVATANVCTGPVGVAAGEKRIWVACRDQPQFEADAGSVARLRRDAPVAPNEKPAIPLPGPKSVAVGISSVWVVNGKALFQLGGGKEPEPIPAGERPDDVAVDGNFVWVSDEKGDTVTRVDPTERDSDGNYPTETVKVGDEPRSIDARDGLVWVANAGDGTVTKIDADQARVKATIEGVGTQPTGIAAGRSSVWVTDNAEGMMRQIDIRSAELQDPPIPVAASPRGVAVGLASVWVASGAENVVQRFDGSTREPIGDPIPVGVDPADVTVGDRAVYTANQTGGTVSRIEPPLAAG